MASKIFKEQFAARLVDLLKKRGYLSHRSPEGVTTRPILDCLGCTRAMARRYLTGLAIPEYGTLLQLANYLAVNPGWLLFGDADDRGLHIQSKTIHLPLSVMQYVLTSLQHHLVHVDGQTDCRAFMTNLMTDLSRMQTDDKTLFQAVDLAFHSLQPQHAP